MDDNSNDDTRQGLYNEFESEIVKAGNSEAYFDENDLIEIFDYASDMDNYIVKMEVLFYGARHYPQSEALATRRAWFYSSFGEMEAAAELNNRVSNGGVLNRLLSLRAEGATDSPATRRKLDAIVNEASEFGDEDVIQLVDFCAENEMLDWVEDNRLLIESKCSYTPTLIYEYADRAEDLGDLSKARQLFEELTMMEPFTLDFWVRLARVQYDMGDDEDALSSVDYALAIDTSCSEALRIKGKAMFRLDRDLSDVSEVFRKILDDPEHTDTDAAVYAATLHELGHSARAIELLDSTLGKFQISQPLLDVMMRIDFKHAEPYLAKILASPDVTCETIVAWAKEHISNGSTDVATKIVVFFNEKFDTPHLGFLSEMLYISGMYTSVIEAVNRFYPVNPLNSMPALDPAVTFPFLMSFVRLGLSDIARKEATEHLDLIDRMIQKPDGRQSQLLPANTVYPRAVISQAVTEELPARQRCQLKGYVATLRDIVNSLSVDPPLPPDSFDPLLP